MLGETRIGLSLRNARLEVILAREPEQAVTISVDGVAVQDPIIVQAQAFRQRESEDLHLSPRFKSRLKPFVAKYAKQAKDRRLNPVKRLR
ncbi:MAG: hypothetical protein WB714_27900 [Candidatus Sulfotelmatobacter sp.]